MGCCNDNLPIDFCIYAGKDDKQEFRYIADCAPVDLTGSVLTFECSIPSLDQEAIILNPVSGEFYLDFPKSVTSDLEQRRVKYEVNHWPTGLTGEEKQLFRGSMSLVPEGSV